MRSLAVLSFSLVLCVMNGCATIGQVVNVDQPACHSTFTRATADILASQGEKPEVADDLADRTIRMIALAKMGPRPFLVSSPSGADYTFFVQVKKDECLLRLYGRQKGRWTYTNDLTYIATRALPSCSCAP